MNNICAYCQRLLLTIYILSILNNIPWLSWRVGRSFISRWSTSSYKGDHPRMGRTGWPTWTVHVVWGRKNSNACHTYLNCIRGHTTCDSPKLPVTLWPWQTSTVTMRVFCSMQSNKPHLCHTYSHTYICHIWDCDPDHIFKYRTYGSNHPLILCHSICCQATVFLLQGRKG